jgi:hypothetical protein
MSMGGLSKLSIDTIAPAAGSPVFEYLSENLVKTGTIIDTGGIRGSRSHIAERVRAGNYTAAGPIDFALTPTEANLLLPWALGGTPIVGTPAGKTTFPLGESIPERFVTIDRVARRFTYAGVKVGRLVLSAAEGEPIRWSFETVAKTETDSATAFAPTGSAPAEAPFVFTDGVLTLLSVTRQFKNFTLTIDNVLDTAFNNSVSATRIDASDRVVSLAITTPFTASEIDLYNQAVAGAAGSLIFTNGTVSLEFTFGRLHVPAESPRVAGKGEIPLTMNMIARKTGSTDELSTVLDLTP